MAAKKAKTQKSRKATFKSEISQLKNVREFIEECCNRSLEIPIKMIDKLQLAIDEAFCNIIKHSYLDEPGHSIIIHCKILKIGVLLRLSDTGGIFNPETIPEPNFTGEQEGGFGWYIIREIADSIFYFQKRTAKGFNHLYVFKRYSSKEEAMNFEHTIANDVIIIIPEGDSLDATDAPVFKTKVLDLMGNKENSKVILDLGNLQFIDSSGLGSLLSIQRNLNARKGDMKLAKMNKQIRTIFELVSMHKIFEIYPTIEDALNSFPPKKASKNL